MTTARVTSTKNTSYVRAGQVAVVERTPRVDALIAAGVLIDLDPPAPPSPAKKRRARQKTTTVQFTEGHDSDETAPRSDENADPGTGHPESP